jgi:hypothetical protein
MATSNPHGETDVGGWRNSSPRGGQARSLSVTQRYQLLAGLLVGRAPVQPVPDEAEWMELVALAQNEGAGPLLHRAVCAASGPEAPAAARRVLAVSYFRAVDARLRQEAARQDLCRRLSEREIPALLLKGAALALTCYEDPATRTMGDLDVLVPRSRLEEAARCLEGDSFRPASEAHGMAVGAPWGVLEYVHEATSTRVELHWKFKALGRKQREAMAEIWSGARPLGGDRVGMVMHPGHAIPSLCAHMVQQHQRTHLLGLFDLHRLLLTTDPSEIALAHDAADRWRLAPCTALSLLRVRELFGTPLPQELQTWAQEVASHDSLPTRMALYALRPEIDERPNGNVADLLLNHNWSLLYLLFPTPGALREHFGLAAHEGVFRAYLTLWSRYLRRGPAYLRLLWRSWQPSITTASPLPPCSGNARRAEQKPVRSAGKGMTDVK